MLAIRWTEFAAGLAGEKDAGVWVAVTIKSSSSRTLVTSWFTNLYRQRNKDISSYCLLVGDWCPVQKTRQAHFCCVDSAFYPHVLQRAKSCKMRTKKSTQYLAIRNLSPTLREIMRQGKPAHGLMPSSAHQHPGWESSASQGGGLFMPFLNWRADSRQVDQYAQATFSTGTVRIWILA